MSMSVPEVPTQTDKFVLTAIVFVMGVLGYRFADNAVKSTEARHKASRIERELKVSREQLDSERRRINEELDRIDRQVKQLILVPEVKTEAQIGFWKRQEERQQKILELEVELAGTREEGDNKEAASVASGIVLAGFTALTFKSLLRVMRSLRTPGLWDRMKQLAELATIVGKLDEKQGALFMSYLKHEIEMLDLKPSESKDKDSGKGV